MVFYVYPANRTALVRREPLIHAFHMEEMHAGQPPANVTTTGRRLDDGTGSGSAQLTSHPLPFRTRTSRWCTFRCLPLAHRQCSFSFSCTCERTCSFRWWCVMHLCSEVQCDADSDTSECNPRVGDSVRSLDGSNRGGTGADLTGPADTAPGSGRSRAGEPVTPNGTVVSSFHVVNT